MKLLLKWLLNHPFFVGHGYRNQQIVIYAGVAEIGKLVFVVLDYMNIQCESKVPNIMPVQANGSFFFLINLFY